MYPHGPFFSYTLLFLVVVLMVPASSTTVYDADKYSACVNPTEFDCGGHSFNISYPFGSPSSPPYCSLPLFSLSCSSDKNTLVFENLGNNIQVQFINYKGSVFTAPDFTGDPCLRELDNPTLLDSFTMILKIDVPPNEYLVYINCTEFSCNPGPSYYESSCERKGLASAIAAGEEEFWDAFQLGVGLTWSNIQEDCSGCLDHAGACGYDSTDDVFACYKRPSPKSMHFTRTLCFYLAC